MARERDVADQTTLASAALIRGRFPRGGVGRRIARLGDVGAEPPVHLHGLARCRDVDRAVDDKNAKDAIARSGKDARAANCNQPEQAAQDAFRVFLLLAGPIQEDAAFHETELSAGVGDVTVDRQARGCPEPQRRVGAKSQRKPGRLTRQDRLLDKHVGTHGKRAAGTLELGKGLAAHGLHEARSRRRVRDRHPKPRSQTGAEPEKLATVHDKARSRARLCRRHRSHPPADVRPRRAAEDREAVSTQRS